MENQPNPSTQPAAEQIFGAVEQGMEGGEVRDLWLNVRSELDDGGIDSVRTYLESEYERRKAALQNAVDNLLHQLKGV